MKVAISECLLGHNCKYNGGNNLHEGLLAALKGHDVIPVCPESLGGLPIPRVPAEIKGNKVINKDGIDVSKEFFEGAQKALSIMKANNCDLVILKSKSPSCGVKEIYDGSFLGRLIPGRGVFAKLAYESGCEVVDIDDESVWKEKLRIGICN